MKGRMLLTVCLMALAAAPTCLLRAQEGGPASVDYILSLLTSHIAEQDATVDIEQLENDLRDIAEHPVNLNSTDTRSLESLLFLSEDQILNILLYTYRHPMQSVDELQLVPGMDAFTIRLLRPFVYVGESSNKENRYHDWLSRSRHEVLLRTDTRQLTTFDKPSASGYPLSDPVYASLRYKWNGGGHLFTECVIKRDAGERFNERSRYGITIGVNDIALSGNGKVVLNTAVAGDYRAHFGAGLVINSGMPPGKSGYAARSAYVSQGLTKYSGTSDDFLRGAAATVSAGGVSVSAFYSLRSPYEAFLHHVLGTNVSYKRNRLSAGVTVVEDLLSDSLPVRNTYYNGNYFRGQRQFSASVNARYAFERVSLFGEAAVSQNNEWGTAILAGARYVPVQEVALLALYRYYSPYYNALHASAFGETSIPNDEHGGYVGTDISLVPNWRFSAYADMFAFAGAKFGIRSPSLGYDWFTQAEWFPSSKLHLLLRARDRRKGDTDTWFFRCALKNMLLFRSSSLGGSAPALSFQTQIDASLVRNNLPLIVNPLHAGNVVPAISGKEGEVTTGVTVSEQAEYTWRRVPLTMQVRAEAFYVPEWNNRLWIYENDVLHAYSVPAIYGVGARAYLNLRYHISEHYVLYLRMSDTWYTKQWVKAANLASAHRPDIHLMLRIKY